MFTTSLIAATAALLASNTMATPIQARTEYCDPAMQLFNLTVTSVSSGKYNNAPLAASHTGALEEALAVLPSGFTTSFTFNQTEQSTVPGYCGYGYLRYSAPAQPNNVEQQMTFWKNDTSNVNAAFFGIGNAPVLLAIANAEQELFYYGSPNEADNFWYICSQTTLGYTYETLSHVAGGEAPSEEGCDQVRVFKIGGA